MYLADRQALSDIELVSVLLLNTVFDSRRVVQL